MTIRKVKLRGKTALMIDFRYTDVQGLSQRFRKVADVQTMAAARAEEARLQLRVAQDGAVYRRPEATFTLREFCDQYWYEYSIAHHKPSTRERYNYMLNQGIFEAFGDVQLSAIDATMVSSYAAKLTARGIQAWPHTSLITSILRAAVDLGQLDEMPKLPSHRRKKSKLPSCPSTAEVDAMLKVARGWLRVAIALAAYAGLRCGEARALEVRDIDWQNKRILVRRAMSADVVTTTKSDQERIVPIAPALELVLRGACDRKRSTDRIVLTEAHKTPRRQAVLYRFTKLLARHGLPHRSYHSLRHYFCSSLLQGGASVELVRVVAGHQDLDTTARYLHAQADDAKIYMGKLWANTNAHALN